MSKRTESSIREELLHVAAELTRTAQEVEFSVALPILSAATDLRAAAVMLRGGYKCRAYRPWVSVYDQEGNLQPACTACKGFSACQWTKGLQDFEKPTTPAVQHDRCGYRVASGQCSKAAAGEISGIPVCVGHAAALRKSLERSGLSVEVTDYQSDFYFLDSCVSTHRNMEVSRNGKAQRATASIA